MGFMGVLCFWRSKKRGKDDEIRIVHAGRPSMEYCDNTVKSSKYTLLTFLPANLFEQFHRPINLYFLLLTALQFTPSVAPVSPFTSLVPLTIAFLITAIKEGIDDWYRHKLDDECNSRWYSIIDMETLNVERVQCRDIRVGAVLLLLPMEVVPCDVVLLLSSGENGEVVISTEALDGETVCKKRYAILSDMYAQRPTTSVATVDSMQEDETNIRVAAEFIRDTECVIESEGPKPFLNSFTGVARVQVPHDTEEEVTIGVNAENVALNSSVLRNTRFALGVAVFTGNETRVSMTRTTPPTKWSLIDQRFNQMVIVVFFIQFILVTVYVGLSDAALEKDQHALWYLGMYEEKIALKEYVILLPLRFFLLVSPMVPLSFKVMVDASKAFISILIKWDEEMSDENIKTEVHNSSLMEDLGQVEYLMTDKTGTLTRNTLTLKSVVATNGKIFNPGTPHEASVVRREMRQDESLLQLMRVLVYCNTVESTRGITLNVAQTSAPKSPPSSAWVSPSPDEVALVEGATFLGVKLLERKRRRAFVMFGNNVESATVLKFLPFTPERRRSSILLQIDGDMRFLLLTKGSDESVLPRCIKTSYNRQRVLHRLSCLSSEGLRTLVSAYRYLTDEEAEIWLADVRRKEAIVTAAARAVNVGEAYESLEKDLIYCGITAVEDQLQDDVCRTITQLRSAGIRVWMLTGDKSQTAKQTAIASGLVGPDDRVIALTPEDVESLSVQEHFEYVERRVNYVLRKRKFQEAEKKHNIHRSWYVRSGLRDFVGEFFHHESILSLLYHPSSKSFSQDCDEYFTREDVAENEQEDLLSNSVTIQSGGYVILFSGKTIEFLKECGNKELFVNFKRVLLHASTVICSRMAPEQKSFVVRTVKKAGHVTLAIGDGGNDVSMIQSAHVGIGMRGREGTQATAASDVVVSQFCFLSRLLLFHGHTAYQRSAIIVQQSFWKTVALAWMQLLFNIYTKFSGVSFWDSFSLMMYNSLFTVPVTFLCALNIPLSASVLLNNPQLYILCQRGRYLNMVTFYGYVFRGFLHGTIIFFLAFGFLNDSSSGVMRFGHPMDRACDFYVSCFALVTLHSCIILLETHYITFFHWLALIWSVVALFLCLSLYGLLSENHSLLELLRNASFYLQWNIVVAVPFISLSVYSAIKLFFFPDVLQLQRLIIHKMSKVPFLSGLWPFWVDENPSRFWGSFSVRHWCRDKSRTPCGSQSVGGITSLDMQAQINAEDYCGEPHIVKMALDTVRDSTALSEPFIKRV
ncbi:phospholipid-transporting ATPase-like protein, putative [Trypanosoma cruzi]|uniref:Phospholipid-transporting ATPase n=1 Tax=Trypanosoma cruzi (strain CL Brener) TaxID=353153 RepID=Q4DPV1_TRYCC|nr:phospholipid-transporting ATPase-like protein, putative [Trypanosoma cruzi]EAN94549.1 phospholipid-transporting ATPase-like protein, putative [Trypanosoma cruzi]|eukprot:XP_816400.1 phospholipid-transporting ATPase-like protein [Trypanosoma cruzi strain CL Brener]